MSGHTPWEQVRRPDTPEIVAGREAARVAHETALATWRERGEDDEATRAFFHLIDAHVYERVLAGWLAISTPPPRPDVADLYGDPIARRVAKAFRMSRRTILGPAGLRIDGHEYHRRRKARQRRHGRAGHRHR